MENKRTATCSRCGQTKKLSELNGYDPVTRDYSQAYCRRLVDCDSVEVDEIVMSFFSDFSSASQGV